MGAHFHLTLVTHSRGLPWFFLLILKFSWIISHVCVTRHRSRSCHPRQTSWSGQPPWKWFLSRIPYNDHLRSWCSSPNSSKRRPARKVPRQRPSPSRRLMPVARKRSRLQLFHPTSPPPSRSAMLVLGSQP